MEELFQTLSAGAKFKKRPLDEAFKRNISTNFFGEAENTCGIIDIGDYENTERIPNHIFEREEEVNAFRNRLLIKVKGSQPPHPVTKFADMNISKEIKDVVLKNIEESDWKEPTAIQMQATPAILQGRDILAGAPTGSGKTAAYVIPALSLVGKSNKSGVRVLLLAPTWELADQIHREAIRLSAGKRKLKILVLKKASIRSALARQDKHLLFTCDILVATPLRLLSALRQGLIDLSEVRLVVLDEADKLFEHESSSAPGEDSEEVEAKPQSFLGQIDEILASCTSSQLQRCLFSATLGPQVQELASGFLRDPLTVTIGVENSAASTIRQRLVFVGREDGKLLAVRQLVQQGLKPPVLLFVQSIERAKDLFQELAYDGINVDVIHADRTQQQRDEVIARFRRGDIWVLICTDLMARGVDFRAVNMVVNYDLPQTGVAYIHRIGRTGRAGRTGEAVTLFTESDIGRLRTIANVMKLSGCDVPDWMLAIKPMSTKKKKLLRAYPPKRVIIRTGYKTKKSPEAEPRALKRPKTDVLSSTHADSG